MRWRLKPAREFWRRRGAGGGTVKSGQHDLVVISSAMAGLQVSMSAG
jgi:hypothetical protein